MRIARSAWALGLALSSVVISGASGRAGRATASEQGSPAPVSFNRDILPILSNNCFACHGPDEKKRETKFHFDTRDGAFAKKGVIVPGNAADSLLVQRITNPDPDERMPPAESGHTLTRKADRSAAPVDRRGREVGNALGVHRRRSVPSCRPIRAGKRAGSAIRSTTSSWRGSSAKA